MTYSHVFGHIDRETCCYISFPNAASNGSMDCRYSIRIQMVHANSIRTYPSANIAKNERLRKLTQFSDILEGRRLVYCCWAYIKCCSYYCWFVIASYVVKLYLYELKQVLPHCVGTGCMWGYFVHNKLSPLTYENPWYLSIQVNQNGWTYASILEKLITYIDVDCTYCM